MSECPLLADISGLTQALESGEGVGEDLRLNISPKSSYQVLRDARSHARNNERSALANGETIYINQSDWKLILDKVPEVLRTESKDIEVVAWYIEGLTRCFGFRGLAVGFTLARQLIETFAEKLHPLPDEDGKATQLAPLVGLNGFGGEGALIAPIKSIPLTEGGPPGPLAAWQCEQVFELERIGDLEKREARIKRGNVSRDQLDQLMKETSTPFLHALQEDIALAITEYEKFQKALDSYSESDPQPTGKIMEALQSCNQVLTYIAGDRLKTIIPEGEEAAVEGSENGNVSGNKISPAGFIIEDREDALKLLRDVASFFRRTEPHSPISYSVEQAIRWSNLPLTDLIKELIPDESARKKYQNLSGISAESAES